MKKRTKHNNLQKIVREGAALAYGMEKGRQQAVSEQQRKKEALKRWDEIDSFGARELRSKANLLPKSDAQILESTFFKKKKRK